MMALPEPVMLVGVIAQKVLLVARLTTPAKPLSDVMWIVEFETVPGSTVMLAGLAARAKSCTMYMASAEWDKLVLVPVTVTSTFPADAKVQDRVALPEPVTLVGLAVHEVLLVVKLTTLEKPLRAVIVIVDVPAEPARTVTEVGPAITVKSWTL